MSNTTLTDLLGRLRDENPRKFVSQVRLVWPDIKAALQRGHSVKAIHEQFVKGGIPISYRLFALYVGQLRREDTEVHVGGSALNKTPGIPPEGFDLPVHGQRQGSALVQVPKKRLFSARAAAQYLGIHEETLKKITNHGDLRAKNMGARVVYALEELDWYIESLPRSISGSGRRA